MSNNTVVSFSNPIQLSETSSLTWCALARSG